MVLPAQMLPLPAAPSAEEVSSQPRALSPAGEMAAGAKIPPYKCADRRTRHGSAKKKKIHCKIQYAVYLKTVNKPSKVEIDGLQLGWVHFKPLHETKYVEITSFFFLL